MQVKAILKDDLPYELVCKDIDCECSRHGLIHLHPCVCDVWVWVWACVWVCACIYVCVHVYMCVCMYICASVCILYELCAIILGLLHASGYLYKRILLNAFTTCLHKNDR